MKKKLFLFCIALDLHYLCPHQLTIHLTPYISMKNFCTQAACVAVAILSLLLGSCSKKETELIPDRQYLAVKLDESKVDEAGDTSWLIIDSEGNPIADAEYSGYFCNISSVEDGMFWVAVLNNAMDRKEYTLYNIEEPQKPILEGMLSATMFHNGRAYICDEKGDLRLIDKKGNTIKKLPKNVEGVNQTFTSDELSVFVNHNEKYGYLDADGEVAIPAKWKFAGPFNEGLAVVGNDEKSVRIIDTDGNQVGKFNAKKLEPLTMVFTDGLMPVLDRGTHKLKYIDKTGKVVRTAKGQYTGDYHAEVVYFDGFACYVDGEKGVGIMDAECNPVVKPAYQSARHLSNGLFAVQSKGDEKWGLVNSKGEKLTACKYQSIITQFTFGGNILVYDGKKWSAITPEGKKVSGISFYDCEYGLWLECERKDPDYSPDYGTDNDTEIYPDDLYPDDSDLYPEAEDSVAVDWDVDWEEDIIWEE